MLSPAQVRLLDPESLALREAFAQAALALRSGPRLSADRRAGALASLSACLALDPSLPSRPVGGAADPVSLLCAEPGALSALWALPACAAALSDPEGAPKALLLSLWERCYLLSDPVLRLSAALPADTLSPLDFPPARETLRAAETLHPLCAAALSRSLPSACKSALHSLRSDPEYRFRLQISSADPRDLLSIVLARLLSIAEARAIAPLGPLAPSAPSPRRSL